MAKMSFAQRVKQRAKEAEFSGGSDTLKLKDGVSFFKAKKGKNEIMIIPFEMDVAKNADNVPVGDLWFRFPIYKHFKIGPEDKVVICPKTVGKKCPICEHRAALMAQGRPTDDVEVRELAARKRELYYVVDVQDKEKADQLQIFECSYHNFGRKLEEELREADDDSLAVNFADPDDGAIVVVRMAEETLGKNKYLEATRFDFEARDKKENALVQELMKDATPFGELLTIMSYKELKNLFYDITEDEQAEDPDEEEAPRRPSKQAAKPRREPEPEDDEEPEPEEEKPVRSRKPAKQEDDEEEEAPRSKVKPSEDPDDEEDDEPAPRKRKQVAVDDVEEEPEEEAGPRRTKQPAAKQEDKKAPKCPGKGNYGQDCDSLDECEDCPNWADCRDLTDEYEQAAKQRKRGK